MLVLVLVLGVAAGVVEVVGVMREEPPYVFFDSSESIVRYSLHHIRSPPCSFSPLEPHK
jgi:hypothetical protein